MADLVFLFAIDGVDSLISTMAEIDPVAAAAAEANLRGLADGMKGILDAAAAEALDSAMYASRTGNLDASTYAGDVTVGGDRMSCEFGARAPYASFVADRGFSRTEEISVEAESDIGAMIGLLSL